MRNRSFYGEFGAQADKSLESMRRTSQQFLDAKLKTANHVANHLIANYDGVALSLDDFTVALHGIALGEEHRDLLTGVPFSSSELEAVNSYKKIKDRFTARHDIDLPLARIDTVSCTSYAGKPKKFKQIGMVAISLDSKNTYKSDGIPLRYRIGREQAGSGEKDEAYSGFVELRVDQLKEYSNNVRPEFKENNGYLVLGKVARRVDSLELKSNSSSFYDTRYALGLNEIATINSLPEHSSTEDDIQNQKRIYMERVMEVMDIMTKPYPLVSAEEAYC